MANTSNEQLLAEQSNLISQIANTRPGNERSRLVSQLNDVQRSLRKAGADYSQAPNVRADAAGRIIAKGSTFSKSTFGQQQSEEAIQKEIGTGSVVQQQGRLYRVSSDGKSFVETKQPTASFGSGSGQIASLAATPLGSVPVSQLRPDTREQIAARLQAYDDNLASRGLSQAERLAEVKRVSEYEKVVTDPNTGYSYRLTKGGFERLPDTEQLQRETALIKKVESGNVSLADIIKPGESLPVTKENVEALKSILSTTKEKIDYERLTPSKKMAFDAEKERAKLKDTFSESVAKDIFKNSNPSTQKGTSLFKGTILPEGDYVPKDLFKVELSEKGKAVYKLLKTSPEPFSSRTDTPETFKMLNEQEVQAYKDFLFDVSAGAGSLAALPALAIGGGAVATAGAINLALTGESVYSAVNNPTLTNIGIASLNVGLTALDIKSLVSPSIKSFLTPTYRIAGKAVETESTTLFKQLSPAEIQTFEKEGILSSSATITGTKKTADAVLVPIVAEQFGKRYEYLAVIPREQYLTSKSMFELGKQVDGEFLIGLKNTLTKGNEDIFSPIVIPRERFIVAKEPTITTLAAPDSFSALAYSGAKENALSIAEGQALRGLPQTDELFMFFKNARGEPYDAFTMADAGPSPINTISIRGQAKEVFTQIDETTFTSSGKSLTEFKGASGVSYQPLDISGETKIPKQRPEEFRTDFDVTNPIEQPIIGVQSVNGVAVDILNVEEQSFERINLSKRQLEAETIVTSYSKKPGTLKYNKEVTTFKEGDIFERIVSTTPTGEKASFDYNAGSEVVQYNPDQAIGVESIGTKLPEGETFSESFIQTNPNFSGGESSVGKIKLLDFKEENFGDLSSTFEVASRKGKTPYVYYDKQAQNIVNQGLELAGVFKIEREDAARVASVQFPFKKTLTAKEAKVLIEKEFAKFDSLNNIDKVYGPVKQPNPIRLERLDKQLLKRKEVNVGNFLDEDYKTLDYNYAPEKRANPIRLERLDKQLEKQRQKQIEVGDFFDENFKLVDNYSPVQSDTLDLKRIKAMNKASAEDFTTATQQEGFKKLNEEIEKTTGKKAEFFTDEMIGKASSKQADTTFNFSPDSQSTVFVEAETLFEESVKRYDKAGAFKPTESFSRNELKFGDNVFAELDKRALTKNKYTIIPRSMSTTANSKLSYKYSQSYKLDTESAVKLADTQIQKNSINSEFKLDSSQINKLSSEFKIISAQKTDLAQQTKTVQLVKLDIGQQAKTQPNRVPVNIPRIDITPKIPRNPRFPSTPDIESSKSNTGYNVYVKEKGKYIKVNKNPQSNMAGLALGEEYVDNTAAKSFKLVATNKRPSTSETSYVYDPRKLRRPKKGMQDVYIEKNKYAIDSPGERAGITAKGLRAKKRKSLLGRFKINVK